MGSYSYSLWKGAIMGSALSLPLLLVCVVLGGGGHGIYVPMIACFPYSMLLAVPPAAAPVGKATPLL
jgi:hypothetical protein